jgi:anion-transporting  ArsA/GET3 family ATPase
VNIAEMLDAKRVCVCAGSGGVGKTTTSAAIALGIAATGAKVAVVTIDPANRLANALGLEQLENEPRRVEPARLETGTLEIKGELWAMMLDPKRTFDELIDRIAPDPGRAQEIKENRVYRELSTAVSGSQELTAIAKLYELDQEHRFDLLVLDTPPSRNALEFLDAPGRLNAFLEGRALKAFMRPTGLGIRAWPRTSATTTCWPGATTTTSPAWPASSTSAGCCWCPSSTTTYTTSTACCGSTATCSARRPNASG